VLIPRSTPSRVLLASIAVVGLATIAWTTTWRPLNVHTGHSPEQPIPFSHRLHAGELGVDCLFCHYGARTSRHAGIPPTGLCMNCHATVSSGLDAKLEEMALAEVEGREPRRIVSEPIAAIYSAMGLGEDLEPTGEGPTPIPWVRVHDLQDFVAFDHSVHVARGLDCSACHGAVQSMERVRQESDLSMGWCIECHRSRSADPTLVLNAEHGRLPAGEHVSTDCAACHY
jgi:hypothetical protein